MAYLGNNAVLYLLQKIKTALGTKVDKEAGKGLSTNDLTDELKQKILNAGDSSFSGQYSDLIGAPTTVSAFTNDAGYQTAQNVETAITGKGYQTSEQVETAITGKGYQTATQVEATITEKGYQTASQVESAITGKGYQTESQVNTLISNSTKLSKEIVETLPEVASASENKIYLILKSSGESGNIYDEYMLVNGAMEKVGDTSMNLDGYYNSTNFTEMSNEEVDSTWNTVFTTE